MYIVVHLQCGARIINLKAVTKVDFIKKVFFFLYQTRSILLEKININNQGRLFQNYLI